MHVIGERVDKFLGFRVANLKMDMRSAGTAGIPAIRYDFILFDRDLFRLKIEIDGKLLLFVLLRPKVIGYFRSEAVQMPVNRRGSIGMRQIQRISIAPRTDRDTGNIAFLHGMYGFAYDALRFHIDSSMEMVRTELAAIPGKQERKVQRVAPFLLRWAELCGESQ